MNISRWIWELLSIDVKGAIRVTLPYQFLCFSMMMMVSLHPLSLCRLVLFWSLLLLFLFLWIFKRKTKFTVVVVQLLATTGEMKWHKNVLGLIVFTFEYIWKNRQIECVTSSAQSENEIGKCYNWIRSISNSLARTLDATLNLHQGQILPKLLLMISGDGSNIVQ